MTAKKVSQTNFFESLEVKQLGEWIEIRRFPIGNKNVVIISGYLEFPLQMVGMKECHTFKTIDATWSAGCPMVSVRAPLPSSSPTFYAPFSRFPFFGSGGPVCVGE